MKKMKKIMILNNFYVTGDCHGNFDKICNFIKRNSDLKNIVIFIVGDVGLNYFSDNRDIARKEELDRLNATFICLRGNHDKNHQKMDSYKKVNKYGGIMYKEKEFQNIFFTKDGEIYDINGCKIFCCGGAYSVDKYYRIENGWGWFEDEQPQKEDITNAVENIRKNNYKVNIIMTHTCPYFAIPKHMFLSGIDQSKVDNTTEIWLESLLDNGLEFDKWFCGHYHLDGEYKDIEFLYKDFICLNEFIYGE